MAELTKKLYVKNTSGTTQTIKLYSTTAEANASGSGVLNLKVDNVNCYAGLGSASNSYATSCKVKNSSGTTLAILSQGGITAGSVLLQDGDGFTVPSGVKKIKVTYYNWSGNVITKYAAVTSGEYFYASLTAQEFEIGDGQYEWFMAVVLFENSKCLNIADGWNVLGDDYITVEWSNDINNYSGALTSWS